MERHGRGEFSLYQRPGDAAYEIAYTGSDGRRRIETLREATTRAHARKLARAKLAKRDAREDAAPKLTFDELADDFFRSFESKTKTGERSARSLDDYKCRYRVHLQPRLGHLRAQALTRGDALRLLDDLRASDAAPATISAVWRTFVRIVNHGRDRSVLSVNIGLGGGERLKVRNARKVLVPTPEEADRIIAATAPRWRVLVETAAFTGARISELLGLQWADVDLAEGKISITKQLARTGETVKPKTERGVRIIRIGEHLRLSLLTHYHTHSVDKRSLDFIFAADTSPAGRYRLAARALAKAVKDAGIEYDPRAERVSFHCFRHGVASQLVRKNIDPQRVAEHLGDTIETVLSTYVHSFATDVDENPGELLAVAARI